MTEKMSTPTEVEVEGVIEIRDPEIDVRDIVRRIRESMAVRSKLPPLSEALGGIKLFDERKHLRKLIEHLHEVANNFGAVDTVTPGWLGRIHLFLQGLVRRVVRRYIGQQRQGNEGILAVLYHLAAYLEEQDAILRARFRRIDDNFQSGRAALVRPGDRGDRTGQPVTPADAA
jgi:hypothetical protein